MRQVRAHPYSVGAGEHIAMAKTFVNARIIPHRGAVVALEQLRCKENVYTSGFLYTSG